MSAARAPKAARDEVSRANSLAEHLYGLIKRDIFDFRLLPGERFTETEMAERHAVSRTPVRDALYRLEREGYLQVAFRSGWSVRPFDFDRFEQLYDLRTILEIEAVRRLCKRRDAREDLAALEAVWCVEASERMVDSDAVAALDEAFHAGLVASTGNDEIVRVHQDLSEKIRIIRRLDFTKPGRVDATYKEHAELLRLIAQRKPAQAEMLLRSHIEGSRKEVRKITLHMLHAARERLAAR